MKAVTLSVPVFSFRRIESPYERAHGYRNYMAVIDARHLPDLSKWRKINVRDAKLRGRVPHAIKESFLSKADEFLFMNRGLVIAAERVDFKEGAAEKKIDIVFKDPDIHGLLDGGHTYTVVNEEVKVLPEHNAPRYLRVEFITGFDRETISDVVEARNTSNQVKDESLANLRKEFEPIKEVLRDEPYFKFIAWSEYEELENGQPKPIDVRDIISYLIAFDKRTFNTSTAQPLIAYKDKRACLRHFQQNAKAIARYYPLLPDILKLWDEIHAGWRGWYNEGREEDGGVKGRFGRLTAITQDAVETLYFKGTEARFRMPEAYKYPILSALRAAIDERTSKWVADPFALLQATGPKLTNIVGTTVRATNSPNKVGKDAGTWSSCYLVVESEMQSTMTHQAQKKIEELEAQLKELRRTHAK